MTQVLQKTLLIVSGYEGLSGLRPDGKYYPHHVQVDPPGVLTEGRGHKLTAQDISSGRFNSGLTLDEVNALFIEDLQPRAERLDDILRHYTDDQFAGALSAFYNEETMWTTGTPGMDHRLGKFKEAAQAMLLYIKSDGLMRLGLWRRRMSEALCYLSGDIIIAKDSRTESLLQHQLQSLIPVNRPAEMH